jgi:hypothetical protein
MCFQQAVVNRFHDILDKAFEASAAKNPTLQRDLQIGQCVLVDWPNNKPPSIGHPTKRGPYQVLSINHNTLTLAHIQDPLPPNQPASLQWSKQAHVYSYFDVIVPVRVAHDPSASAMPIGAHGRQIDCVLSHSHSGAIARSDPMYYHVDNLQFECRMWGAFKANQAPILHRTFEYDCIKHTYALDSYIVSHSYIIGHTPIAHMPATWNPHAVSQSLRPSHPPVPPHERNFPLDNREDDDPYDALDD